MSLSYSGEHLAWKQRLSKEAVYNSNTQDINLAILAYSPIQLKRKMRRPIIEKASPLRSPNPYAEIRGRYAACAKLPEFNKVISRPSTQGSLIKDNRRSYGKSRDNFNIAATRTFNGTSPLFQLEEADKGMTAYQLRPISILKKTEEEPAKVNKEKQRLKLKPIQEKKSVLREGFDIVQRKVEEKVEEKSSVLEEESVCEDDQVEGGDDLSEDMDSEVSFLTTNSKHRYIERLESLIRQERNVIYM